MNYENDPQYQKDMARLRRMDPGQLAIINSMNADKKLASDEIQKKLSYMQLLASRTADENKNFATEKELDLPSMRQDMNLTKTRAGLDKTRADLEHNEGLLDLKQGRINFESEQDELADNIGLANVAVSGLSGFFDMRAKQKEAAELAALRQRHYGGVS